MKPLYKSERYYKKRKGIYRNLLLFAFAYYVMLTPIVILVIINLQHYIRYTFLLYLFFPFFILYHSFLARDFILFENRMVLHCSIFRLKNKNLPLNEIHSMDFSSIENSQIGFFYILSITTNHDRKLDFEIFHPTKLFQTFEKTIIGGHIKDILSIHNFVTRINHNKFCRDTILKHLKGRLLNEKELELINILSYFNIEVNETMIQKSN